MKKLLALIMLTAVTGWSLPQGDLSVSGDISITANMDIKDSSDSEIVTIDETNKRVGIGTTSPDRTLEVEASSATMGVKSTGVNSGANLYIQNDAQIWLWQCDGSSNDVMQLYDITNSRAVLACDTSGNVGIGTSSPGATLDVNGGIRLNLASTDPLATDADGDIIAGSSDKRLKDNVIVLQTGLKEIMALEPIVFEWKKGTQMFEGGKKHYGFIAQKVEEVLPYAVGKREQLGLKDCRTFSNQNIVPALVKAVQEMQLEILNLKTELAKLKGE